MTACYPLLTPEQKRQFQDLGYCAVPNLFTKSEIREIEVFFEDYRNHGGKVFDSGSTYQEIDITQRQLRAMHPHRHSDKVKKWFLHPPLASVLEELLGKPALGVQTMYYYKPPGAKGQGMHQDNFYLLAKPATCIAAWTAIDDATIDNGCLYVVPKSNHGSILCPSSDSGAKWMGYGDSHITKFPRDEKLIPVEVPRGTTVFFGGNLIHGSGANRTRDLSRRTFIGHYIDEASQEVAQFYHPIFDFQGQLVSSISTPSHGGGPCGDGWQGATH